MICFKTCRNATSPFRQALKREENKGKLCIREQENEASAFMASQWYWSAHTQWCEPLLLWLPCTLLWFSIFILAFLCSPWDSSIFNTHDFYDLTRDEKSTRRAILHIIILLHFIMAAPENKLIEMCMCVEKVDTSEEKQRTRLFSFSFSCFGERKWYESMLCAQPKTVFATMGWFVIATLRKNSMSRKQFARSLKMTMITNLCDIYFDDNATLEKTKWAMSRVRERELKVFAMTTHDNDDDDKYAHDWTIRMFRNSEGNT